MIEKKSTKYVESKTNYWKNDITILKVTKILDLADRWADLVSYKHINDI